MCNTYIYMDVVYFETYNHKNKLIYILTHKESE